MPLVVRLCFDMLAVPCHRPCILGHPITPTPILYSAHTAPLRFFHPTLSLGLVQVLFADTSGFTALTERLAVKKDGAEEMCDIINRFFTRLIAIAEGYVRFLLLLVQVTRKLAGASSSSQPQSHNASVTPTVWHRTPSHRPHRVAPAKSSGLWLHRTRPQFPDAAVVFALTWR